MSSTADPVQAAVSGPGAKTGTADPVLSPGHSGCSRASEGPPQAEMSPDQLPELNGMHKAFPGQECLALLCLGVYSTLFIQRVSLTEPSIKSYLQLKQNDFGFVRASLQQLTEFLHSPSVRLWLKGKYVPVDGAEYSGGWRMLSVWKQQYSSSVAMKLGFFCSFSPFLTVH